MRFRIAVSVPFWDTKERAKFCALKGLDNTEILNNIER